MDEIHTSWLFTEKWFCGMIKERSKRRDQIGVQRKKRVDLRIIHIDWICSGSIYWRCLRGNLLVVMAPIRLYLWVRSNDFGARLYEFDLWYSFSDHDFFDHRFDFSHADSSFCLMYRLIYTNPNLIQKKSSASPVKGEYRSGTARTFYHERTSERGEAL